MGLQCTHPGKYQEYGAVSEAYKYFQFRSHDDLPYQIDVYLSVFALNVGI